MAMLRKCLHHSTIADGQDSVREGLANDYFIPWLEKNQCSIEQLAMKIVPKEQPKLKAEQ